MNRRFASRQLALCRSVWEDYELSLSHFAFALRFLLTCCAVCAARPQPLDAAGRADRAGETLGDGNAAVRGKVRAAIARGARSLVRVGVVFFSFAKGAGGSTC